MASPDIPSHILVFAHMIFFFFKWRCTFWSGIFSACQHLEHHSFKKVHMEVNVSVHVFTQWHWHDYEELIIAAWLLQTTHCLTWATSLGLEFAPLTSLPVPLPDLGEEKKSCFTLSGIWNPDFIESEVRETLRNERKGFFGFPILIPVYEPLENVTLFLFLHESFSWAESELLCCCCALKGEREGFKMEGVGFVRDRRAIHWALASNLQRFTYFNREVSRFVISLDTVLVVKPETPRRPYGAWVFKVARMRK